MRKFLFKGHWWLAIPAGAILLVLLGYFALSLFNKVLLDAKSLHHTTATVMGKAYLWVDQWHNEQTNERGNDRIHPGYEEWRVYYQIDNFNQLAGPKRSHFLALEKERAVWENCRYIYYDKEWYDGIRPGDKLIVLYQAIGDKIEIVNVVKPQDFPQDHPLDHK